jgi:hypothetical protein
MKIREELRWFLIGMGSITIFPTLPEPELGDISDDWKAVRDDLRNASRSLTSRKGDFYFVSTLSKNNQTIE